MRIVSIISKKQSLNPLSSTASSNPQVVKLLWRNYLEATLARLQLQKQFGLMEIKHIKGGYALYTVTFRRDHSGQYKRLRRLQKAISQHRCAHGDRDKFLVGTRVKLAKSVPEHFITEANLSRKETYCIGEKHSIKAPGDLSKRKGYFLKTLEGLNVPNIVFYSYDLVFAIHV